jgi:hypothetical protein
VLPGTVQRNKIFEIDIGVMPLPDDEWAKGKCGLKVAIYGAWNTYLNTPVRVNLK